MAPAVALTVKYEVTAIFLPLGRVIPLQKRIVFIGVNGFQGVLLPVKQPQHIGILRTVNILNQHFLAGTSPTNARHIAVAIVAGERCPVGLLVGKGYHTHFYG